MNVASAVKITPETHVPSYIQLRDQLGRLITAGALEPGEQLPSLREVAMALGITMAVVQEAYDGLRQQGKVELVRGRGTFVSNHVDHSGETDRRAALVELARSTTAQARMLGFNSTELIAAIKQETNS